jgi:hypothetical protein
MTSIVGEARGQVTLFPMALEDLIPADHLCPVIMRLWDGLILRHWVSSAPGRLTQGWWSFNRNQSTQVEGADAVM